MWNTPTARPDDPTRPHTDVSPRARSDHPTPAHRWIGAKSLQADRPLWFVCDNLRMTPTDTFSKRGDAFELPAGSDPAAAALPLVPSGACA